MGRSIVQEPESPDVLNAPAKTAKFTPTGVKINVYQPFLKQPTVEKLVESVDIADVVEDPEPNEEVYRFRQFQNDGNFRTQQF